MSTILKWAGNKTAIMSELKKHLPAGPRLVEPFAGSCAVMMATDYPHYLVADINPDLINLYRDIATDASAFIERAKHLFKVFNSEDGYYDSRDSFNYDKDPEWRAPLFLFLNRHCYRGLCRYNKKGGLTSLTVIIKILISRKAKSALLQRKPFAQRSFVPATTKRWPYWCLAMLFIATRLMTVLSLIIIPPGLLRMISIIWRLFLNAAQRCSGSACSAG